MQLEWLLSTVPTLIGTVIIVIALFYSSKYLLAGRLQIDALSTSMINTIRNALEPFKYIGGG